MTLNGAKHLTPSPAPPPHMLYTSHVLYVTN